MFEAVNKQHLLLKKDGKKVDQDLTAPSIGEKPKFVSAPDTLYHEVSLLEKGIIPPPRMAILITSYLCNQNCYYCFFSHLNDMNMRGNKESIIKILHQLKDIGVKAIEFCGGGEPLITPNMEDIFIEASNMGFRLGLLTNGVFFKGSLAETYLARGTYVRFSVDTVDRELYKKVRGADHGPIVLENIKNALEIRAKHGYNCEISAKIGVSKEIGLKQIKETYDHFDGWGLNNIQVKNLWEEDGTHYRDDVQQEDVLKENKSNQNVISKVKHSKKMNRPCWITPVQLTLDFLGDVYLCCYYMHRKESHRLTNLFEKPLDQVWGTQEHWDKMKQIKMGECMVHDCRFQKYMQAIEAYRDMGKWEFV